MSRKLLSRFFVTSLCLVVTAAMLGTGCPAEGLPGGGDNTGGDNTGGDNTGGDNTGGGDNTPALTIVKTDIDVRHDAAIRAGNDLVVYGTGTTTGVSYLVPSTSPTTGTAVPDSDKYDSGAFAVGSASNYIFLVGANTGSLAFQVSVFNVDTAAITRTFTTGEIRLAAIPASEEDDGNIQASGPYCAVVCDANTVTDGKVFKFIDASASPPIVTSFSVNPASSGLQVKQCAIDATSKKAVAVANDSFWVYDMTSPTTAPVEIPSPNGIAEVQMQMCNNTILALDDQAYPHAILVDLSTNTIVNLSDGFAAGKGTIGDDTFALFTDTDADDRSGGSQRAAVGTIPGPGYTKAALAQYIDGSTANNGLRGFAGSMFITPDSDYLFLSDSYLQVRTSGATFAVLPDPSGTDTYGCPAWDVHCTNNTAAFKTAATTADSTTTKVGYIRLP